MVASLPVQLILGSSALFSIFSYVLGSYYIDAVNDGGNDSKPLAAFFIAMPMFTQIMCIVSLILIFKKDGSNFIIAILAILQFAFVFSVAALTSVTQAQLDYVPEIARKVTIFNNIYTWSIVVVVFSWVQSLIMGGNVVYHLLKMDKPVSMIQAQLNSSK